METIKTQRVPVHIESPAILPGVKEIATEGEIRFHGSRAEVIVEKAGFPPTPVVVGHPPPDSGHHRLDQPLILAGGPVEQGAFVFGRQTSQGREKLPILMPIRVADQEKLPVPDLVRARPIIT